MGCMTKQECVDDAAARSELIGEAIGKCLMGCFGIMACRTAMTEGWMQGMFEFLICYASFQATIAVILFFSSLHMKTEIESNEG